MEDIEVIFMDSLQDVLDYFHGTYQQRCCIDTTQYQKEETEEDGALNMEEALKEITVAEVKAEDKDKKAPRKKPAAKKVAPKTEEVKAEEKTAE